MANPVFDLAVFDRMTDGDRPLQLELVSLFRAQGQLWQRLLTVDAPVATWRDAAHTMKGAARGLGLHVLAQACVDVEDIARATGPAARADAESRLEGAKAALQEALEALERYARNHDGVNAAA